MKKLKSNFIFFILLIFFSLLAILSSLFFKKLMLVGAVFLPKNTPKVTFVSATTTPTHSTNTQTLFSTTNGFLNMLATNTNCHQTAKTAPRNLIYNHVSKSCILLESEPQTPIFERTHLSSTSFSANANTKTHQTKEITTSTPLYKSTTDDPQNISNIFFSLPKTYYVEILNTCKLDSGADGYFVRYGNTEGYCVASSLSANFSTTTTTQSGITIQMYPDAGTYIRSTPNITGNKIRIIPQSTNGIIYIGSITGDTPTDGTTNTWYYVEYNISDTKTVLGYIYSERGILSAPLTELTSPNQTPTPPDESNTETPATATPTADTNFSPSLNLSVSPALKWVIALLFIIPVIVIFALLIKKPRKNTDFVQDFANNNDFPTDEDLIPEFCDTSNPERPRRKVKFSSKIDPFVKFSTTLETSSELAPETLTTKTSPSTLKNYPTDLENLKNDFYSSTPQNYAIQTTPQKNFTNENYNSSTVKGFDTNSTNFQNNTQPNNITPTQPVLNNSYNNHSSNKLSKTPSNPTSKNTPQTNDTNPNLWSNNLDNSYEKLQNCQKNSKNLQNFNKKSAKSSNFTDPTVFYKNSTTPTNRFSLMSEDSMNPDCIKNQNIRNNSNLPPEINLENTYTNYYENITNQKENLEDRDILSKPKFPKINIDDGYEFAEDFSISPTINFSLGKADFPRQNSNTTPRRNTR